MNVLFVSIDSLRRDYLSAYRDRPRAVDYAVDTPNLDRFADRAATFETHYAGSLPCMPARREWLAGVQEFLWRPWGPMEPFDRPVAELARRADVLPQLITDHYHYVQHGSHGYYEDFAGFEFVRGHEYDAWETLPRVPDERLLDQSLDRGSDPPRDPRYLNRAAYARNAARLGLADPDADEADFFGPRVFSRTAEWLRGVDWDDWFCYVDSFDVHEPFHCPEPYASMYTDEDPTDPDLTFWPYYGPTDEGQSALDDRELAFVRSQFAGKVTMVDEWFGRVMDALDARDRWDDTAVIVTSDHGFFLGEHGWVGKNEPPVYDVLARTPLLAWVPGAARTGESVEALTAAVDLYPTMLELLGVEVPERTHGRSLRPLLAGDRETHRERALYGYWGGSINVTDGRDTYLRPTDPDEPSYCYSTTMMNPRRHFTPNAPKTDADAGAFLPYTDSPVWRFEASSFVQNEAPLLFDSREDPAQARNLTEHETGRHEAMRDHLIDGLDDLDAPDWQYERLDLP